MDARKQREHLAAWIAEWRLEKDIPPPETPKSDALREAGVDVPAGIPDLSVAASGGRLEAGDVVLLPPLGEITSSRPIYVALLECTRNGNWLCAPFSRFSTPATEDEFATGRRFAPLKVVCVWNAGLLAPQILDRGWLVARLAAADIGILAEFVSGRRPELPPARRGPPLVHPLDPRHAYIEEERSLWLDFRAFQATVAGGEEASWEANEPPALDFAAEKPDKDGK